MREIAEVWRRFLEDGEWIREVPQASGEYPVATLQGERGTPVVVYCDPAIGEYKPTRPWGGFFWSIPLPPMPPVPEGQIMPFVASGGIGNKCSCGAIAPAGWNKCLSCKARGRFRK